MALEPSDNRSFLPPEAILPGDPITRIRTRTAHRGRPTPLRDLPIPIRREINAATIAGKPLK
jgi:hypothetical protein